MRKLTILGATGSIGSSTLAVVAHHPEDYQVVALTAHANVDAMLGLCLQWQPRYAAMADIHAANVLKRELKRHGCATEVLSGSEGVCALAALDDVDSVMAAIVGAAGFAPTMAAVKAGKRVLLANKEALVMSGQFLIDAAMAYGATLLPVDSEHNALFQCLPASIQQQMGYCDLEAAGISKLLLTGSGGPFRYTELEALNHVTPAQAIMHPNWSMGPKISVDSATMMNKGLEYIEAKWLFNARQEQLEVIIHPQSVIHSMVQYQDGSVLAQLGQPDMKTPIAVALDYPHRIETGVAPLDFCALGELSFIKPDYQRYPCLKLAIEACYAGQAATTTLNAANEEAVVAFLAGQIGFMQIATINDLVLQRASLSEPSSFDDLLELDSAARHLAQTYIARLNK